jgi:hypothetical protein
VREKESAVINPLGGNAQRIPHLAGTGNVRHGLVGMKIKIGEFVSPVADGSVMT